MHAVGQNNIRKRMTRFRTYCQTHLRYPRATFGEVASSTVNQELSVVRASSCSGPKSLEWVKNPALVPHFPH